MRGGCGHRGVPVCSEHQARVWCSDKGLVQGYDEPAGKFLRPGEKVARERVAVVLARAFDMGILR